MAQDCLSGLSQRIHLLSKTAIHVDDIVNKHNGLLSGMPTASWSNKNGELQC
jgi:hypothetical protein